jgi:hypothetical protein
MTFFLTVLFLHAVEDSLRRGPLLGCIVLVFFENSGGRPSFEFDSEVQRQGGEFMFVLRNIFVSMDKSFHLVFKNGE